MLLEAESRFYVQSPAAGNAFELPLLGTSPVQQQQQQQQQQQRQRNAFRILVDGERYPGVVRLPPLNLSAYQLGVFTGGSNLHPNAVYLPLLALEKELALAGGVGKPAAARGIDLLYRSSWCTGPRERLATQLRRAAEAAGLRFVSAGRCTAGADPRQSAGPGARRTPGGWDVCDECADAKLVLAFEKFEHGKSYLSEKVREVLTLPPLPLPLFAMLSICCFGRCETGSQDCLCCACSGLTHPPRLLRAHRPFYRSTSAPCPCIGATDND